VANAKKVRTPLLQGLDTAPNAFGGVRWQRDNGLRFGYRKTANDPAAAGVPDPRRLRIPRLHRRMMWMASMRF
jgi:hypothetical protein